MSASACRSQFQTVVGPLCGFTNLSALSSVNSYCSLSCAVVYGAWLENCVFVGSALFPTNAAYEAFDAALSVNVSTVDLMLAFNSSCGVCAPTQYAGFYNACSVNQSQSLTQAAQAGAQDLLLTMQFPSACPINCSSQWTAHLQPFYSQCIVDYPSVPTPVTNFFALCSPPTPPQQIGGIQLAVISQSAISVSWQQPAAFHPAPDAPMYNLTRYAVVGDQAVTLFSLNVTRFVDTGLTAGTQYAYQVVASTSAGAGSLSVPFLATTLQAPPSPPASLNFTNVTSSSAALSWSAVTVTYNSSVSYIVYRQTLGSPLPPAAVYTGSATMLQLQALTFNTSYNISVAAATAAAGVGQAIFVTVLTTAAAPSPPTALPATAVTVSSFTLSWLPPTFIGSGFIASYTVQLLVSSTWTTVASTTGTSIASAAMVSSLTVAPVTQYTFRVVAVNSGGLTSGPSSPLTVMTPANPPIINAALNVTVSGSAAAALVFWNLSAAVNNGGSPLTGIVLQLCNMTTCFPPIQLPAASQQYALTGLQFSTSYGITWRVLNAYGWSTPVPSTNFTIKTPAPAIVSLVAGDNCACRTTFGIGSTLTLTFSAPVTTPDLSTQAAVDAVFQFTPAIPGTYSGAWSSSGTTATITVLSVTGSGAYAIGLVTASVLAPITDAAGLSLSAAGEMSPPLTGSWYGASRTTSYFNQTQAVMRVMEDSTANPIVIAQATGLYAQSVAALSFSVVYGSLQVTAAQLAAFNASSTASTASSLQLQVPYPILISFLAACPVTYSPMPLSTVTDVLTVAVQDTLSGGYASDSTVIPISITQVNHAPAVQLSSAAQNWTVGGPFILPPFNLTDPDTSYAPQWPFTVAVLAQQSTTALFTLSPSVTPPPTVSTSAAAGVSVPTLSFSGPVADLNTYFAQSPVSVADAGQLPSATSASLLVYVDDNGNGGLPAMTATASLLVGITCVGTTAPAVQSAAFSNDLGSIVLSFSVALDQTAAAGASNCSLFFTAATVATFGLSPSCVFRGSSSLVVVLGYGASVLPNTNLAFASSAALRRCSGGSMTAGSVAVQEPVTPIVPVVTILGPTSIGLCDGVTLLGQATGLGGRPNSAAYSWSVSIGTTSDPTAAMPTPDFLDATPSSTAPQLVLTAAQMYDTGAYYFFYLTVSNFLGSYSTAQYAVFKSGLPLPQLLPQGGLSATYATSSPFYLAVTPVLSTCLAGSLVMNFSWAVSPPIASTIVTSRPQINIPPYSLPAGSYAFTLTGTMTANSALFSTVTINVTVPASAVAVSIGGGAVQQFSSLHSFTLFATGVDPDQPNPLIASQNFAWSWSCMTVAGTPCFDLIAGVLLNPFAADYLPISAGQLAPNAYVFTATGVNAGRTASASVTVSIVANPIPTIAITSYRSIVNPNAVLFYSALVTDVTGTPIAYSWTQLSGPPLNLQQVAVTLTYPTLVLNNAAAYVFAPGATYTFQCSATNGYNQSNYAQVSVTINAPPFGGVLTVSPSSGFAFNTSFSLSASGWQSSSGLALNYQFFMIGADGVSLSQLSSSSAQSVFATQLAQSASGNVSVVVMVTDALSATSTATAVASVAPPPGLASDSSGATYSNILSAATMSASQTSDVGQLFATLSSLSSSLALSYDESETALNVRRRLLLEISTISVSTLRDINGQAQDAVAANVANTDFTTGANTALQQMANTQLVTAATVQQAGGVILAALTSSSAQFAVTTDIGKGQALQASIAIIQLAAQQLVALVQSLNVTANSSFVSSRRLLTESGSDAEMTVAQLLINVSVQCDTFSTDGQLAVSGQSYNTAVQGVEVELLRNTASESASYQFADDNSTVAFPASSLVNATYNNGSAVVAVASTDFVDSRLWYFAVNPFVWADPYVPPISAVVYVARTSAEAETLTVAANTATAMATLTIDSGACPESSCTPVCLQWWFNVSVWTNASVMSSDASGQSVTCTLLGSTSAFVAAFAANTPNVQPSSTAPAWSSSSSSASSSSSVSAASSTASLSSSTGAAVYPAGSVEVAFYVSVTLPLKESFLTNLTYDIAFNLAAFLNISVSELLPFVEIVDFNNSAVQPASSARRLLTDTVNLNVSFVLLGTVSTVSANGAPVSVSSVVSDFQAAAAAGNLSAPTSGATIPMQTAQSLQVGTVVSSSSSSTGTLGATAPSSSSSSSSLAIGLGVGLGVGIPVVIAIIALIWHFAVKGGSAAIATAAPTASSAMLHQRLPAASTSQ